MSALTFIIKRGDTLPYLEADLTNDGVAADISGTTGVDFVLRAVGASKSAASMVRPATIVSAAPAKVRYQWQVGDTDVAGRFIGEFQVNYGNQKASYPSETYIAINIMADLG